MSCAGAPANSAQMVVNLAFEGACAGIADPAAPVFSLQKEGAVTAQPIPASIDPGTTDGSGFKVRPILGPVTSAFDLGTGADPVMIERFFRAITRGNWTVNDVIDAGPPVIYKRVYRYDPTLPEVSMTGRFGIQDIASPLIWTLYGMQIGGMTITAAAGAFVTARITGQARSFSRYAPFSEADPGNLGTYAGPQMRGQPSKKFRRHVLYVKIVDPGSLTPSLGYPYTPLQYKVEAIEGGGVPTFTGQTYYQTYAEQTDGTYEATWRDYHDQNGEDVGTVDEPGTRLPVQIVFPGEIAATAAAIAVDDVWSMSPIDVAPLIATYDDAQGFTLAHKRITLTDPETGQSEELQRDDVTITYAHPLAVAHGDASNFVTRMDRTDENMLTVAVNRGVISSQFLDAAIDQRPLDVRIDCEGSQWPGVIATIPNEAAPRRSFAIEIPSASVASATMAIAGRATVTEAITFQSSQQGFTFEALDELDTI